MIRTHFENLYYSKNIARHFPIVWIGSAALSIKRLLFAACKAKNIAGNYKAPNCTKSAQQLLLNV